MIVVRVELHHATQPGKVTELARMQIANAGTGTKELGNYFVRTLRGRDKQALDQATTMHESNFQNFPRKRVHVWNLVLVALLCCGYRGYQGHDVQPIKDRSK